MCAILAVRGELPDRVSFDSARDLMAHRGPDDAGTAFLPEEGVALGHRRLSIIDLSPAGRQPMESRDGKFLVVFNGEIYNFRELKEELKDRYPFRTTTDTEAIIAAYAVFGEEGFKRLRGMFAFTLYDRDRSLLFCVRDRLGVKPLYYATAGENFYAASEIKSILALADIPRRLDRQALLDYLSFRYPLGHRTHFEGVRSLLPGCYLTVGKDSRPLVKRYWSLPVVCDKPEIGEEEALAGAKDALVEAVASHLISDVPLGAYLSGGLDSSVLVAVMASLSREPVKTFSAGFSEEGFSEFPHARAVAKRFGTDHRELTLSAEDYLGVLPEVIRYKDAPLSIPNEAALYRLSSELRRHITVVLSGEGADELFGGYGRIFRSGDDFLKIKNLRSVKPEEDRNELRRKLEAAYGSPLPETILDHFLRQYSYFPIAEKRSLLAREYFRGLSFLSESFFGEQFAPLSCLHPSEQIMHVFERAHLLGPLHRLDMATMAKSVETRVPYVDHLLVEHVSALPLSHKMRFSSSENERAARLLTSGEVSEKLDTTKYLLKRIGALYGVPGNILARKKLGFPVPLAAWLTGPFRSMAEDLLLSSRSRSAPLFDRRALSIWLAEGSAAHPGRGLNVWMLMNVELWMREYGVTL